MKRAVQSEHEQESTSSHLRSRMVPLTFMAVAVVSGMVSIIYLFKFLAHPSLQQSDLDLRQEVLWIHLSSYVILSLILLYFAFRWIYGGRGQLFDRAALLVALIGVAMLYLGSFNPMLAPNGDNAEYLLTAKSLVERGGAYRLHTPNETANGLASLGLPLLLSPIYYLWGMDLFKMKALVMLFGIGLFPLVFTLLKRLHGTPYAALLSILIASCPYLVSMSTTIMTETPFVFWSILVILIAHVYCARNREFFGIAILLLGSFIAALLTRAVGITLVGAFVCYFIITEMKKTQGRQGLGPIERASWIKLGIVMIPLLIGFGAMQFISAQQGVSPIGVFLNVDIFQYFANNGTAVSNILGQMLASEDLFRWWKILPDTGLPHTNMLWISVVILTCMGLIRSFLQRPMMGSYLILALLVVMLASRTPQEMVLIRYLLVLLPFLLYFLVAGFRWVFKSFRNIPVLATTNTRWWSFMVIFLLYNIGMFGNMTNIAHAKKGYGAHYESFIRASAWCGINLPEDAYIMSVKPRITHLYSLRKATSLTGTRDVYTDEYDRKKIDAMFEGGITHLIIDAVSARTKEVIYPLLRNHPDLFEAYDIPELEGKCTVVRFIGDVP